MTHHPETMAFLHARGLDVKPKVLAADLRAAVEAIQALYYPEPGEEGLTAAEVETALSGGLDPQPTFQDHQDPLLHGVVSFASIIKTGLTTLQAAAKLRVTDARIRQRLHARTLLAIREGRSWKLPLFQFAPGGELPGWAEVCPRIPRNVSPVALDRWLALAHPDLVTGDGTPVSPRRWLLEGRPPGEVAALAGELA